MPKSRKNKKATDPRVPPAFRRLARQIGVILDAHQNVINTHALYLEQLRAFLQPLVKAHIELYPEEAVAALREAEPVVEPHFVDAPTTALDEFTSEADYVVSDTPGVNNDSDQDGA